MNRRHLLRSLAALPLLTVGGQLFAAPRATVVALACALAVVALLSVGCGAEQHPNDPRPQPPTRVSVAVFNHVSTAYVCGRLSGEIEPSRERPRGFNAALIEFVESLHSQ